MGHCISKQSPQLITTDSSRNSGHDGTNNYGSSIVAKPTSKRMKKRVAATAEIVVGSSNVGSAIHKPQRLGTTNEEEEGSQYRRSGSTAIQSSSSSINSSSDVQSSIVVVDRQKRGSSSSLTLSTSFQSRDNKLPISSFTQSYQIIQPQITLGYGIAGQVQQCINRSTSQPVAVKIISKSRIQRQDRIKREIAFLKQVHHPNIIQVYDVYEDEDEVHIVTEMCRGGELFDRIIEKATLSSKRSSSSNNGGRITRAVPACFREKDAARIIHSLLSAVPYLHSKDIVHRDIKPENILFTEKDDDESPIKLINFGLSIRHNSTQHCDPPLTNTVGTSYYMAPELLRGSYDRSCDLWSIGVITCTSKYGSMPNFSRLGTI